MGSGNSSGGLMKYPNLQRVDKLISCSDQKKNISTKFPLMLKEILQVYVLTHWLNPGKCGSIGLISILRGNHLIGPILIWIFRAFLPINYFLRFKTKTDCLPLESLRYATAKEGYTHLNQSASLLIFSFNRIYTGETVNRSHCLLNNTQLYAQEGLKRFLKPKLFRWAIRI